MPRPKILIVNDNSDVDGNSGIGGIPIIVISGQPAPELLDGRIQSWLTKPIPVDELVDEIHRSLALAGGARTTGLE